MNSSIKDLLQREAQAVLNIPVTDGLYLSDSHYKNPSFDENKLRFRRFKLVHYNKK